MIDGDNTQAQDLLQKTNLLIEAQEAHAEKDFDQAKEKALELLNVEPNNKFALQYVSYGKIRLQYFRGRRTA